MEQIWEHYRRERDRLCGDVPARLREMQPLVHLLTNYVTVTDCVNAVLAAGGRAICSHAPKEAAQVTAGADALVCNLGGTEYYDAMDLSAAQALSSGIPLVIDPVGCAASAYRREKCLQLTRQFCPAAIRGNYAEIAALTDDDSDEAGRTGSKGLDSTGALTAGEETQLQAHMRAFSRKYNVILIASGSVDLCTDGETMIEIACGTPMLRRITGAGCLSTALLAAYLAAECSLFSAAAAVRCVGLAGEAAEAACRKTQTGAGHFHMFLMDALSM